MARSKLSEPPVNCSAPVKLEAPATVPVIRKLKGFSSLSLVVKEMSPVLVPAVVVSNWTVKVSDAPAAKLLTSASVSV